ncbi:MAG: NAD(P)H-dependent oxidoreductase [Cenarchaeum sp. SB0665_bin_23]|nr:NAD(P)H-dependent oxidoreductase [Cenarchaeum sp. SB0665_bin_23]MXZ93873.1 NAD(P)H-dependent oxidoreductase [Cenarchaeum sp. SB0666_bin_15]MYB46358.1 NAD(P)H-dependent oxidoreductase [Cenarchaeum sp. SB0662_bin_33]MYC79863.1 NAD(P)H-dependent oxidoreductase [Cenarchaeum sp. SB0661_bin_35]MYD58047.1 NAD(P)H-dependent oxidoreductase [Cenarchaeum sp. SB0678_bin_8]MYG32419.1 NAD(P)H-dependent oxidoreductase [Cenarchaeum sp. SB0677_bin_16]MYJ27688.1 NAD(P)H-dependent oxidoreductase [Cenarchaeum
MKVVVISASPRVNSVTQIPMKFVYEHILSTNMEVELINLAEHNIECFRGFGVQYNEDTLRAAKLITDADIWIVGTPIYNSFFSGALKNLFEYVNYKSTAGKVAGIAILASGNIGFTDVQTLLTQLLNYFQVITNPKAVYMTTKDIVNGVVDETTQDRLKQMVDDTLLLAHKVRET